MPDSSQALETRGRLLSLTELTLDAGNEPALMAALDAYIDRIPAALRGLPVLLDADGRAPVTAVLRKLADAGIPVIGMSDRVIPVGAVPDGFPVIQAGALGKARVPAPSEAPTTAAGEPVDKTAAERIQTQPVRSGQQIYADGGDLIVLAPVSPGAEVVADGCVHVYAPLRGRAIAGARGDTRARVFCHKQEAELIAVAGTYAVAEQIQDTRGQSVQAFLDGDALRIQILGG